ncbi:ABC transporter permease [Candidatus Woesearchaeota archaeon]|jgi:putative ABC transport system permease protein|nr:ABC transporter permease [Candidatus Woesearchaeota archaeon]MBT3537337.1 ABC transporter permease [Candidatus Woesearchaeota archaeon]MBT4697394.1 ABC transporter permease [Candidatus Woesearchaeota archaeon]MBT4716697.1 ABC transporter permease [Candidatus Woesearchaeota archaeon]MBT7106353.1 ABC transporter permease [Candidatus Woesearchaeota archaeon]
MIKEYLNLILKSFKNRQLRSWLTVLGIIIGVTAIVALISISQGMENAITEQFQKMGTDSLRVLPPNLRGPPAGDMSLPAGVADYLEKSPYIDYIDRIILEFATVEYGNEEEYLFINAYDTELESKGFSDMDLEIEEGRAFKIGEKGNAIIGYDIAHDQFDKAVHLGTSIIVDGQKFKVIGIFEKTGINIDDRIYIPLDDAKVLFDREDEYNVIVAKVRAGVDIETAQENIEKRLTRKLGEDEFNIYTPAQLLEQINSILGAVQMVLVGIAFISLLVGAIGIMNAMYTSVLERTREIGVMKAIGARNGDIMTLFLLESGIMGLAGGVVGVIVGSIIAYMVEVIAALAGFSLLSISIDYQVVLFALAFAFVVGIVSGTLPAIRAAGLKPVDALRYE